MFLLPGKGEKVTVDFAPAVAGSVSAQVEIDSNDPSQSEVKVSLAGTGEAGVLSAPATVSFNPTRSGTSSKKPMVLKNTGKGTLSGTIPSIGGLFSISPVGPFSLKPGKSLSASVIFSPTLPGIVTLDVVIGVFPPSQPSSGVTVQLTGTGK